MPLSKESRDALARAVQRLRALFEDEFSQQASGRFGLHTEPRPVDAQQRAGSASPDDLKSYLGPWIEPRLALSLTPSQIAQREELVGAVEYLHGEGATGGQAVARVIREAAFTAVNRLLAVRVAEAVGVLPEALARGRMSAGYRDVVRDLFPLLLQEEDEGLWAYLQVCGDELGATIPLLFDRRLPTSAFAPSRACVDNALEIIDDPAVAQVWAEPEALGWAYQFFNQEDERQRMRAESTAPRDSRELAVRNQFFTPRYVVDWLVQNTLGRRLRQAGYEIDLPLLVGELGDLAQLDLDDVRILDPAVGSGHFLLGCYDLLEQAWQTVGVPSREAAPRILRSLYGIEIDPRASQVAQAVLVLRARRATPDGDLTPPAIVTARPLPGSRELRREIFDRLSENARELADELDEGLRSASTVGSLLRVEQRLAGAFDHALRKPKLAKEVTPEQLEGELLEALDEVAQRADASPAARLFAADAHDAIRFVELCRQRYDTVLMNPPFGLPMAETSAYLRDAYPNSPGELFACFVSRGLELVNSRGLVGAITNRTGFFLSSLESWRRQLILDGVVALADLGSFVLQGAQVEVAAYVTGQKLPAASFVRCLQFRRKERILQSPPPSCVFRIDPTRFLAIPNSSFAYWVGEEVLDQFGSCEQFASGDRVVSRGLSAGDNFRFIRARWEVPPQDIETGRWKPLAKGGEYSPFWDDVHLVLDWSREDEPYREVEGARIFNLGLQGKAGVCWPKRTTSMPSARPLPAGAFFEANSIPAFAPSLELILGWANTRLFALFFLLLVGAGDTAPGSAAKDWITGPARRLPWREPTSADAEALRRLAREAAHAVRAIVSGDETSADFVVPDCLRFGDIGHKHLREAVELCVAEREELVSQSLRLKAELDAAWLTIYELGASAASTLDRELEPAAGSYPDGSVDAGLFERAYLTKQAIQLQEGAVEDEEGALLESRQQSRLGPQVSLRSIEDLCHIFGVPPETVLRTRRGLGLLRQEDVSGACADLISYIFGCAMGRWDLRIGRDHSLAPAAPGLFEPVSACPPGMLVGLDGFPGTEAPAGYALELPPSRILVDEPGHAWDVEETVLRVAGTLLDDASSVVAELLEGLGRKSLRDYLRRDFFKAHLSRYSKSRRRAPIYWPLAPKGSNWGIWVYAPTLSRETLFAIAGSARDKLRRLREQAENLQQRSEGAERMAIERREKVEGLIEEVGRFADVADRVAQSGWAPDLNDGLVLCAAPLEPLFADERWRRLVAGYRQDLEKGKYPWASVQRDFFGGAS